jgi:hypothetical protein
MSTNSRTAIGVTVLLSVLLPGVARAARVDWAVGTVIEPAGLRTGSTLEDGKTVVTGADAIVMISYQHPTPEAGVSCREVIVVGRGERYMLTEDRRPRSCNTKVPPTPSGTGKFASFGSRPSRGSGDSPTANAAEAAANAAWANFDLWVARVGVAERVSPVMGPLQVGVDFPAQDLGDPMQARSAAACANLCANDSKCRAMTYVLSRTQCWLKSGAAPPGFGDDVTSAVKVQ